MLHQKLRKMRSLILSFCCAMAACSAANAVTLYVPSQYPTIQSAFNAAPTNSTILISPGTYNESPSLSNKDRITIQGNGGKPVINGGFNLTNCTNITLQTLESHNSVSGGVNAVGGGNVTVTDVTAVGGWACVVMASFAPNMTGTITNCTANGTALGIDIADGVNPTISSCTVSNVRYWGIHCFKGFGTANIVASTVTGSGYSNFYIDADKDADGDKYFSSDYVSIRQCIANGSVGYYGIELRGLHNGTVYQCSASGNSSYGMAAYFCDQATFKECTSERNFDGFDFFTCGAGLADHCLADHNVASGFVALTADPAYGPSKMKVLNCTAANQQFGVYTLTGWSVEIRDSILTSNNYGLVQIGSTYLFEDYNDFFANANGVGAGYWYYGGHSRLDDPLLTSSYNLKFNSPCIDTGDPNLPDADGSRNDMGVYYCTLPIRAARLGVPRYVQDPPGTQHMSIKVYLKGTDTQSVTGHWQVDGTFKANVPPIPVNMSSRDWTEGPELQIDLLLTHSLQFILDGPTSGQSSMMQTMATGFHPDGDGWSFANDLNYYTFSWTGVCLGMTSTARGYFVAHRALPNSLSFRAIYSQIHNAHEYENAVAKGDDLSRLYNHTLTQADDSETDLILGRLAKGDPCDIGLVDLVNNQATPVHAILGIAGFKGANVYDQYQHENVDLLRLIAVYDPNINGKVRHVYLSQSTTSQNLRWIPDGYQAHPQPLLLMITDKWTPP